MDSDEEQYASEEEELSIAEHDDDIDDKNYSILSEADIRRHQDIDATELSTFLSVSRASASHLLRFYKWNVDQVQEAWFADEEKVRRTVGLLENPVVVNQRKELTCNICFETYPKNEMDAASCGHDFCTECLAGYVSTSIADGPGCLMLQCPDPSCKAAIDQTMIDKLASDEDKEKYSRYLVRAYVESNPKTKWCSGPGCDYAVDFDHGSGNYDVSCRCSYSFCFNCNEDAHRPVNCDTVSKWIFKNADEAENTTWILANSKPCPKCKRPIEKNLGCMHMTCRAPCRFDFCWLCLGPWGKHDYGACNAYKKEDKDETTRKRAKMSLERYHHYYERWTANHKSRQNALADLDKMRNKEIEKLYQRNCDTKEGLEFIKESWRQIVECRRVLKWSYAYGYYISEDEDAKLQLFQYVQGEAESALEKLHHCAEIELKVYLDAEGSSENFIESSERFNEFRKKLVGLTKVTRKYFGDLVKALENGLSDVKCPGICSKNAAIPKDEGTQRASRRSRFGFGFDFPPPIDEEGGDLPPHTDDEIGDALAPPGDWNCEHCTYFNVETAANCGMCSLPRLGGF